MNEKPQNDEGQYEEKTTYRFLNFVEMNFDRKNMFDQINSGNWTDFDKLFKHYYLGYLRSWMIS